MRPIKRISRHSAIIILIVAIAATILSVTCSHAADSHSQSGTIVLFVIAAALILLGFIAWNVNLNRKVKAQAEHLVSEITGHRQAEEALQQNRQQLEDIIQFLPDATLAIDREKRIIIWNRAIEKMTGVPAAEMMGKGDYAYSIPFYGEARPQLIDLLFEYNEDLASRYQSLSHEGDTFTAEVFCSAMYNNKGAWIFIKVSPLHDNSGNIIGAIESIRDISDLKRAEQHKLKMEQQLQQAHKMESLGVLTGGIAHDFNNILAVIICNCSLALQRPQLAGELIPEIETAAQRAAELCRQMLAYAGKTQFFMKQVNVSALLNDMLKMLRSTISQNVVIKPLLPADIPAIKADAAQIRQVIMNLIINAAEAIGEAHGEIGVSLTKNEIRPEHPEKDHLGKLIPPDWYICLEITDNGCGMDDDTKKRIFEPFYSTKFTGRGLGMSENLGIITAHKGAMQIVSQPGHGSSFKVYLPVQTSDTARESLLQQAIPSAWQGDGTILLVEDEPQLMMVAKNLMKALGFTVFEATNGREALELYLKNTQYIRLVVTDVGMPVMDGYELFRELKKITPELPIIISSGFGDVDVTSRITGGEIAGLLSKPYRFDQLRDVLKSVVERKPHP